MSKKSQIFTGVLNISASNVILVICLFVLNNSVYSVNSISYYITLFHTLCNLLVNITFMSVLRGYFNDITKIYKVLEYSSNMLFLTMVLHVIISIVEISSLYSMCSPECESNSTIFSIQLSKLMSFRVLYIGSIYTLSTAIGCIESIAHINEINRVNKN